MYHRPAIVYGTLLAVENGAVIIVIYHVSHSNIPLITQPHLSFHQRPVPFRSQNFKTRHIQVQKFKSQHLSYKQLPAPSRLFADDVLNSDGEETDSPKQQ